MKRPREEPVHSQPGAEAATELWMTRSFRAAPGAASDGSSPDGVFEETFGHQKVGA